MTDETSEISIEDYMNFHPNVTFDWEGKKIIYYTPNTTTLWRCQTILTQEPETIEWISGFSPDQTLVDIGANVGMYTIWVNHARDSLPSDAQEPTSTVNCLQELPDCVAEIFKR